MLRNILIVLFVILAYLLFTPHVAALAQEPQGEQVMVKGLNDATYQAYSMAIVEKAQKALKDEGLYAGDLNGSDDLLKAHPPAVKLHRSL